MLLTHFRPCMLVMVKRWGLRVWDFGFGIEVWGFGVAAFVGFVRLKDFAFGDWGRGLRATMP